MTKTLYALITAATAISCFFVLAPADAQVGGAPPQDISGTIIIPAGGVFGECAFPVQFDLKGKASQINLPGGRIIVTAPMQNATLTNLNNPTKTVTLNITGVLHQSTASNGDIVTVVTGRNLLGDPDAGFVLAIGSFSFTFDKNGNLIHPLAGTGQLIKVCPLIS
jgi:hypothetical protein